MLKTRSNFLSYFICLCVLMQGCVPSLPKNTPKENLKIPEHFPTDAADEDAAKENLAQKNWKLFFTDEQLTSLIEIALKNNQELNILDQEISIANNEVMARQGEYLPKVGIGAGYEHEKVGEFTSQGASDAANGVPKYLNNREVGLRASWEVDIWKKLRNLAKSAYYKYLSSIEGRNFAVTQLVGEIAGDYYELMALDNQLEIIERYIKNLEQAQEVVQLQLTAGRATSLAVKRFAAEVTKNQSRKYEIEQRIVVAENHLNTLLGRLPQPIERDSKKLAKIEMQEVDAGLPVVLLDNRPDIKQASLKLEAAKLEVKAVKTQFYPSLSIDAALGYQSFNSRHFIDTPTSLFYNVAGGITAPLLNRQAIKADYFSANNRQVQAVYDYEQTYIKAFSEVSNQLAAVKNLNQIYALKTQQNGSLAESVEISNILFKAARTDYLDLLLTQRDYLESQMELIEVKQRQLSSYVNLYKALGGGWREETAEAAK